MDNHQLFARKNWYLFALGLACIAAGYLFLRMPPADGPLSLTAAPLLLVLGYCVLIPLALLCKPESTEPGTTRRMPILAAATRELGDALLKKL